MSSIDAAIIKTITNHLAAPHEKPDVAKSFTIEELKPSRVIFSESEGRFTLLHIDVKTLNLCDVLMVETVDGQHITGVVTSIRVNHHDDFDTTQHVKIVYSYDEDPTRMGMLYFTPFDDTSEFSCEDFTTSTFKKPTLTWSDDRTRYSGLLTLNTYEIDIPKDIPAIIDSYNQRYYSYMIPNMLARIKALEQ